MPILRIAPRNGLAYKHQLHVLAGVIGADYRGSIKVLLHNLGTEDITIQPNDRIAQMICEKAIIPHIDDTTALTPTTRDTNALGSTERAEASMATQIPLGNTDHTLDIANR